jgi:hypothetical protein
VQGLDISPAQARAIVIQLDANIIPAPPPPPPARLRALSPRRLRADPSITSPQVGMLPVDAIIEALETRTDAAGNAWARCGYRQWVATVYDGNSMFAPA